RGVAVHYRGMIRRVYVEGRGVGHQGVGLRGLLAAGEDAAAGCGETDERDLGIGGGERDEEMGVDGDLGALLPEEVERGLANGLAGPAGGGELERDARGSEVDPDDVDAEGARSGLGADDVGNAAEGLLDGL